MKNYLVCVFSVCFCILIFSQDVLLAKEAYQAEVENISSRNYFQPVLNAINNARESILMGMYIISLPAEASVAGLPSEESVGGVKQLLEALVNAKKRGVSVKVILEYHRLEDFTPSGLNYNAYHYLKDNGIDVYFDEFSSNCLHLKTIIIDKELVITGSSNWSEAAFKSSYETNFILKSKPLALEITKELEAIPTREEPPKAIVDSFDIPSSFCDSKYGALKRIIQTNDLRSLDLILILWRIYPSPFGRGQGEGNIISCKSLAEELKIVDRMHEIGWRRQIKKSLKKLEERYNLIKYEWQYGKDEIKIELVSCSGAVIKFPVDYYKYNWNTRLSLAGKAVLITMYAERGELTDNVSSLPVTYLSKKYGITDSTYSKGIQELRRFNIIKVQYGEGFKNRDDTRINILGVYDMDDYNKKIEVLKTQYGKDLVTEAVGLAGIIYSAYDFDIVKDILEKINTYGRASVVEAFGYVKNATPDNSKRSYNYVLGILRKRSATQ